MANAKYVIEKLKEKGITTEQNVIHNGPQIIIKDKGIYVADIIHHEYSYGYKEGLWELMGCGYDDVVGNLTDDRAVEIIVEYIEEQEKGKHNDWFTK